ncbi:phospho-N-acetylmuramoyl-pentapeptide-transferase [bacterium]|nr:phospho-N-acetylmuramoyl-pentapeptide-transferase [bacterium]
MLIILSFLFSFIAIPFIILTLKKWQLGQIIREEGPSSHLSKSGTPTMGGILFVGMTLMTILLCIVLKQSDPSLLWGGYMTVAYSLVGFLDDFLKKIKKSPYGLKAREDIALQILLAVPFLLYLLFSRSPSVSVWLWLPFKWFLILAITNSVNLTDGLDGLLTGIALLVFMFFIFLGVIGFSSPDFNPTLLYVLFGTLLAFLYFNFYPAKIFMGNIGSFALGGFIAFCVLWFDIDWLFLVLGGIFLAEALSVILQVSYFKYTKGKTGIGKRIFKMAPLHHHFELMQIPEATITVRFWLLQTLLTIISLFIYTN